MSLEWRRPSFRPATVTHKVRLKADTTYGMYGGPIVAALAGMIEQPSPPPFPRPPDPIDKPPPDIKPVPPPDIPPPAGPPDIHPPTGPDFPQPI